MYILGISAYYHDSAACLVRDGEVLAAAQEERFTRKKHDHRYPTNAVEFCLRRAGVTPAELGYVAFYDKPLLKFERLLETYIDYAPSGLRSFLMAMPLWLREKLWIREQVSKEAGFGGKVLFTEHHESHAASAFFPSPFESAAVLTMDGVGEWATSSYGYGRGGELHLLKELHFPHSLGMLYSAFTYYTGFKVNSGEYEVMEEAMLRMARHVHRETGERNLCLAGGVALNCVGNGRVLREGPFERVWIQPAAGDAGGSLGAALSVWHQYLGNARDVREVCAGHADGMRGAYLGPSFSSEEIQRFLDSNGARYRR